MNLDDFINGVETGEFPRDKEDLGPFTEAANDLRSELLANLFSFRGQLDPRRFLPISSLEEAERSANAEDSSEYQWDEVVYGIHPGEAPACYFVESS